MANLTLKLVLAGLQLAGGKKGLETLFQATAAAFGRELPDLRGLSRRDVLLCYARFTRQEAEKAISGGTSAIVRENLYEHSLRLGRKIRSTLPLRGRSDEAAALSGLYRLLEIDCTIDARGVLTVERCFFARHYTPAVCRLISAMDEGIVAGISGGRLVFSRRLTEDATACSARIAWPDREE